MYNSGNSSKNVTGASIVDGTVETVDIADDAVTADKLSNSVNTDIGTGVSASTTAGDALPKAGGTMTGTIAGFTSTGIDDNATSTAITIDASENVNIVSKMSVAAFGNTARAAEFNGGSVLFDGAGPVDLIVGDGAVAYMSLQTTNDATAMKIRNFSGAVDLVTVTRATGNTTIETGNLVIGTSGKGIDFSATSDGSGTMTSEVLDDYEEGTWIPTITFETPGDLSVAYHANTNATYTKVGRLVTISFYVRTTTFSHSTASGDLRILGIPFTPRTYTGMKSEGGTTYYGLNKSGFTQATVLVNSASSVITMSAVGIAGSSISTVNANDAPGVGGRVDISGVISYETDS